MGVSVPPRSLGQVSASPALPASAGAVSREFDVADLYAGPAGPEAPEATGLGPPLDEKLRQAYFWIVNNAIITPYYDIEFNREAPRTFRFGGAGTELRLPTDMSFSSFVLLPLLNLVARRRALFIGGPGRGKTASAILMGVLSGYDVDEIRRAIQHGQPQMTIADLIGNPLPKALVEAEDMAAITIAWRRWISMRVKIVDEYNRIPTRTQSALMTILHFAKTLAWFRGQAEVSLADLRQILPWCLHEKLQPNPTSPFFDQPSSAVYRIDRIDWIRKAFDLACEEAIRLNLDRSDTVAEIGARFERGLDGVGQADVRKELSAIESELARLAKATKLYAHVHGDVLTLKYLHQRYSNYLRWLKARG